MNNYKNTWEKLWTLEYNNTQEKFHIDNADINFKNNTQAFLNSEYTEWTNLGVFNSFEEAQKYKDFILLKKKTRSV